MPSVLVDGVASPILHSSQLASILGLDAPAPLEVQRLAWDAAAILGGWLDTIGPLDFHTLTEPTRSRRRSLRNLTVNVFHPFELLPSAFDDGWFAWDPTDDEAREAELRDAATIVRYAADRAHNWREWLLERHADLAVRHPHVDSPHGKLTYANLLASQRFHAAFHYRQLLAVVEALGRDLTGLFRLATLGDLELPPEIF